MKKKLKELAEWVNGTVVGDGEVEISGVGSIEEAKTGEITFVASSKYLSKLGDSRASAVIVSKEIPQAGRPLLCVANPYLAFAKILQLFLTKPYQAKGVDPQAWISSHGPAGQGPDDLSLCLCRGPLRDRGPGHPASRGLPWVKILRSARTRSSTPRSRSIPGR